MQLKECEKLLEDATEQINMMLREREEILIEWHKAFDTEHKCQILNKRNDDLTEWQRNLVYATAAELRKKVIGYE